MLEVVLDAVREDDLEELRLESVDVLEEVVEASRRRARKSPAIIEGLPWK